MAKSKNNESIVKAIMSMETRNPEELRRMLDHHMEYLIDFDEHYDTITSVADVMSYEVEGEDAETKLEILSSIVNDILATEPSDDNLDNDEDKIDVYAEIHNLKESLTKIGIGN